MKHLFKTRKTMTATTKNFELIHEVYARQESGEFDIEWGYGEEPELDREAFNLALHEAFARFAEVLQPYFDKLKLEIVCEVSEGKDIGDAHESFVIYLIGPDYHYGNILPTENGFMWMKEGFDPVNLPNLQSIFDFVEFLGNTRYRWIKLIESGESRWIGFDSKNYSKFAWPWIQKGFIRPRENVHCLAYCSIGNPAKCDI